MRLSAYATQMVATTTFTIPYLQRVMQEYAPKISVVGLVRSCGGICLRGMNCAKCGAQGWPEVWWLKELEALKAFAWSNESYAKKFYQVCRELEVGVGGMSPDAVNITVGVQTASSRLRSAMNTLRVVIHTWFGLWDSLSKESAGPASVGCGG